MLRPWRIHKQPFRVQSNGLCLSMAKADRSVWKFQEKTSRGTEEVGSELAEEKGRFRPAERWAWKPQALWFTFPTTGSLLATLWVYPREHCASLAVRSRRLVKSWVQRKPHHHVIGLVVSMSTRQSAVRLMRETCPSQVKRKGQKEWDSNTHIKSHASKCQHWQGTYLLWHAPWEELDVDQLIWLSWQPEEMPILICCCCS